MEIKVSKDFKDFKDLTKFPTLLRNYQSVCSIIKI